jgi:alpha-galactosidase
MKVTIIGGGSYAWIKNLASDFLSNDFFDDSEICLMDINPIALEDMFQLCNRLKELSGRRTKFTKTIDVNHALQDASYVIAAVAIGGFDATIHDHQIARKYGYWNIKGHDIGCAGFSRLLRHIPFLLNLARLMEKHCPQAMLLNVTNPLVANTMAVNTYTTIKSLGFCHGVVNHLAALLPLLGAKSMKQVDFVTAGVDHCSWLLQLKVNGKDGFEILRQNKVIERAYHRDQIATIDDDYAGLEEQRLRFVIWDMLGVLPAISDLHCCEFLPHFFKTQELRKHWDLQYDRLEERPNTLKEAQVHIKNILSNKETLKLEPSGEILAQFIAALQGNGSFIDVLNAPNVGQISNLPLGAIVETKCLINSNGIQPVTAGPLPAPIESLAKSVLQTETLYMQAIYDWDKQKAIAALSMDPLVLDFRHVRQIAEEYFDMNQKVLENLGIITESWK